MRVTEIQFLTVKETTYLSILALYLELIHSVHITQVALKNCYIYNILNIDIFKYS